MIQAAELLTSRNHVETPFIIVRVGDYTFGHCSKPHKNEFQNTYNITFPDYMESLNITKINGAINTYTLTMTYAVAPGDDPNALEKVFSSISNTRLIKLTYGDWNSPSYIYREEEAIITKLVTRVDMNSSRIQYVINCTSTSSPLSSPGFSFPAKYCKPSDELKRIVNNQGYGVTDVFKGMKNKDLSMFIDGSDQEVQLEAKPNTSVIEYINYLVSCMTSQGEQLSGIKSSFYFWSIFDDVSNIYNGAYFKVVKVSSSAHIETYSTYVVDVGYPTPTNVIDFTINNDDSWSLLYDYSNKVSLPKHSYYINDDGELVQKAEIQATSSTQTFATTESSRNWWSLVTKFPITATLKIKGLLRPAMLMSYVKVNSYFYGRKHISSGTYIITKQQDEISSQGYRTTLTLLRIEEDK